MSDQLAERDVQMAQVFFGGPDKPRGLLRNLLAERVDAVPKGGEILWATYYFRDIDLAEALVRAKRRGVTTKVCIEASPRLRAANQLVQKQLVSLNVRDTDFRSVTHLLPSHIHEKIYMFSHPSPVALVGSFNPSGCSLEDAEAVREIGDQDAGHNYLVEIADPVIVDALRRHVRWLMNSPHGIFERYAPDANETPRSGEMSVFFFPRRDSAVVPKLLGEHHYDCIRIAASHFRDRSIAEVLARLADSGASVEVIAHHTKRRVPDRIELLTEHAGIRFNRYQHPRDLPMHSKFILLTAGRFRRVIFGSMNLTHTSRWLNHEVLVDSRESGLVDAFNQRWEHMLSEINAFQGGVGASNGLGEAS